MDERVILTKDRRGFTVIGRSNDGFMEDLFAIDKDPRDKFGPENAAVSISAVYFLKVARFASRNPV